MLNDRSQSEGRMSYDASCTVYKIDIKEKKKTLESNPVAARTGPEELYLINGKS